MKLGIKEGPKFMFKVLECALRAYKGAQGHADWQGQFEWHSEWVSGMHNRVLVQWGKEPSHTGVEISPRLVWCLRSAVRLQNNSEPLRIQVWQHKLFLAQWRRRVPDVWIGGLGDMTEMVDEVHSRREMGRKVYWLAWSRGRGPAYRTFGPGLKVDYILLGGGIVVRISTDVERVQGMSLRRMREVLSQ